MLHTLGRTVARRPLLVVGVWIVLVVAGFGLASGAFGNESLFGRLQGGDQPQVPGESRTGNRLLGQTSPVGAAVDLLLDGVDPRSATVRSAVTAAALDVSRIPGVVDVQRPFATAGAAAAAGAPDPLVAADGRAVLVVVSLAADLPKDRETRALDDVRARLDRVAAQVPGSVGRTGGVSTLVDEINGQVQTDLRTGETIALPLSLLVMVLVFGGLLAASLPVVGALASIAGGLASLLGFSYVTDLDASVPSVVSVLGLGLCIDYGLLLASRFREELRAEPAAPGLRPAGHRHAVHALERTLGTAGRTVLFSAVTVAISLSGLMLFPATILRAVGAAGVSVVLVALLVALTLVPALLALAGDRMTRPGVMHRVPLLSRVARRLGDVAPERGAFSRLARRVQRRPVTVVLAVLAVLVLLGVPALGTRLVSSGVELLPRSSPQRQLFEQLATRFPAVQAAPVQVASRADPRQLQAWGRAVVRGLPGVTGVDPVRTQSRDGRTASVLGVRTAGDAQSDTARAVVGEIRSHRPGFEVLVTGQSAFVRDFVDSIAARAPLAAGVVVLATFLLLFLMTGSVLVPLKALVMNVVSLSASFGVLVWVFQEGHLERLLDFSSAGGVDTTIPALALSFAFGLSMDYEVFLLSRIKELRDAGASNDDAVAGGLQRSGRIITSAAVIVVIVFAGFVAGKLLVVKQIGVALAVAVAVDATLVRMLLVPATMTLLGEWNWWAPGPLRRVHARFGVREG